MFRSRAITQGLKNIGFLAASGVYAPGELGGAVGERHERHQLAGLGLLEQMQSTRVVRCDEAAWRFLGLSLAGYNVLISLALAVVAIFAGVVALKNRPVEPE